MARKQQSSLSEAYRYGTAAKSFESRLLPDPVPRRAPRLLTPALALGFSAALIAGFIAVANNVRAQSSQDLAGVSRTFLAALASGDSRAALEVCAEGTAGHVALAEERRRVFGSLPGTDTFDPQAREKKLQEIERLRSELESAGVQWENIQPLALAGVRARVLQSSLMKAPASLMWGHLYFSDGGRLYDIELTAWQCGDRFIITDIWHWSAVDASPAQIESFAKQRSRSFLGDRKDAPEDTKIMRPRQVFVSI